MMLKIKYIQEICLEEIRLKLDLLSSFYLIIIERIIFKGTGENYENSIRYMFVY